MLQHRGFVTENPSLLCKVVREKEYENCYVVIKNETLRDVVFYVCIRRRRTHSNLVVCSKSVPRVLRSVPQVSPMLSLFFVCQKLKRERKIVFACLLLSLVRLMLYLSVISVIQSQHEKNVRMMVKKDLEDNVDSLNTKLEEKVNAIQRQHEKIVSVVKKDLADKVDSSEELRHGQRNLKKVASFFKFVVSNLS